MSAKNGLEGVGHFVVVAVIMALAFGGYQLLDSVGWIAHSVDSSITAEPNWLVGETKECISFPMDAQMAKSNSREVGNAVYSIGCDKGPEHKIKITFYGRTLQPDYISAYWKCTRSTDSFTCYQTGGEGRPGSASAPAPAPVYGTCQTGPCQPGDTRAFDHVLYVWDGSKWVPKE